MLRGYTVLALLPFLISMPTYGMEKEQFLEVVEALQNKVRNIELETTTQHCELVGKNGEMKELPSKWTGRLVVDGPAGGRIRFDVDSSVPWYVEGKLQNEPGRTIVERAFDGKIGTYIRRNVPTDAVKARALHQYIMPDDPTADKVAAWEKEKTTGIDLIAAYYQGKGLSQLLRGGDWELVDLGKDVFTVTYAVKGQKGLEWKEQVTVDLGRGGAILGTRNLGYRDFFGFANVELREGKDGVWLPISAELREAKDVYKITFKRVEINQELPENTFVLDFDPGAQVWDRIHNVKFIAGNKTDGALKDDVTRVISDVEDLMPSNDSGDARVNRPDGGSSGPVGVPVSRISRRMIAAIIGLIAVATVAAGVVLFRWISAKR